MFCYPCFAILRNIALLLPNIYCLGSTILFNIAFFVGLHGGQQHKFSFVVFVILNISVPSLNLHQQ